MKDRVEKLEIKIEEVGSEMKELRTILKKIQETLSEFSHAIIEMTKNTVKVNKMEKDINTLFDIVRDDEDKIKANTKMLEDNGKERLKFGLQIALGAVSASFAICMGALSYILIDVKDGVKDIKTLSETVVKIDKKLTLNDFKLDGMHKLIMEMKRAEGSK